MIRFHKDGTLPQNNEVFVFGSNLAGIHGAGAAKIAASNFGAVYGVGKGWQPGNKSYAIPTKNGDLHTLPLKAIQYSVSLFVTLTQDPMVLNNGYFVTRIGCGLAGYEDKDIAPFFKGAVNCSFAEQWKEFLE